MHEEAVQEDVDPLHRPQWADLHPAPAGVRAQALRRDGSMVEDFLVQTHGRQVHVLNAPSPAATAALEIADHLAAQVEAVLAG